MAERGIEGLAAGADGYGLGRANPGRLHAVSAGGGRRLRGRVLGRGRAPARAPRRARADQRPRTPRARSERPTCAASCGVLTPDARGALRAPRRIRCGPSALARRALAWRPGPDLRLERLVDPAGRAARARRQRRAARVSRLRALVRRHLRRRPVPARAAAGQARARAGGVGRRLPCASTGCRRCAWSRAPDARGDLLELAGDQADGADASRSSSRCSSAWGTRCRATATCTRRSCATRRRRRRSCSSGASRPTRALTVAIEALALLRSAHGDPGATGRRRPGGRGSRRASCGAWRERLGVGRARSTGAGR